MIAGAARLGNFAGQFCTDGGKMMVKFLCQSRWISVTDCPLTINSFTNDLLDLRAVTLSVLRLQVAQQTEYV